MLPSGIGAQPASNSILLGPPTPSEPTPAASPISKLAPTGSTRRAFLSTLPLELLYLIRHHLDQRSRIYLGRTSRFMYLFFERDIWGHLNLFLTRTERRHPHTQVNDPTQASHGCDLICRCDILDIVQMMDDMRSEGNRKRWRLVKSAKVAPFNEIADSIVQVLVDVSPNLEHLEISPHLHGLSWNPTEAASIESRLIQRYLDSNTHVTYGIYSDRLGLPATERTYSITDGCPEGAIVEECPRLPTGPPRPILRGLSFPVLTSLRLGQWAIMRPESIALLLTIAPNLQDLSFHSERYLVAIPFPDDDPFWKGRLPQVIRSPTRLRSLCVEYEYGSPREAVMTICNLLAFSPLLRQLSLRLRHDNSIASTLIPQLPKTPQLFDLVWIDTYDLADITNLCKSFPFLKRLVLRHGAFEFPDTTLPTSPTLEVVHLTRNPDGGESYLPYELHSGVVLPINASFARWIRACPRLRILNYRCDTSKPGDPIVFDELDEAESAGNIIGRISSMRYGGLEIIHARLQLQALDEHGVPTPGCVLYYTGDDKIMMENPEISHRYPPYWQDYSEFEGEAVPMSVIERMWAAEGLSEEGRKQRGVEVGAVAWGVLMDWRAGRA